MHDKFPIEALKDLIPEEYHQIQKTHLEKQRAIERNQDFDMQQLQRVGSRYGSFKNQREYSFERDRPRGSASLAQAPNLAREPQLHNEPSRNQDGHLDSQVFPDEEHLEEEKSDGSAVPFNDREGSVSGASSPNASSGKHPF